MEGEYSSDDAFRSSSLDLWVGYCSEGITVPTKGGEEGRVIEYSEFFV